MSKVYLESDTLVDIADAIRAKTGSQETMKPSEMTNNVENIPSVSNYFKSTSVSSWSASVNKLPPIVASSYVSFFNGFPGTDLQEAVDGLNIIKNNSMQFMFQNCKNITRLDLSHLAGCKPTLITHMFNGCSNLEYIINVKLLAPATTAPENMFQNCTKLKEIDLSSWVMTITSCGRMFYGCTDLMKIDIRGFTLSNLTGLYGDMFGSSASTGVPDNCLIIVKDQTEKDWVLDKFSRLTNVQTAEEYEASQNNS